MHDPNETGNFDDIDDRCNGVDGIIKYTTVITTDVSDGGRTVRVFASATGRITLRLKRDPDQKRAAAGQLVDNGSTFRVVSTGQMVVAPTPDCTIYGRESMAGSGTFNDPGAEIGAVRSRDILTVGANGETSGFTFANLCGQIGGNPANGSWALPECDGLLDGTAPGAYVFSCWEPAVTLPNIRVLVWSVDGRVRLR
jgi:hypothetical protein